MAKRFWMLDDNDLDPVGYDGLAAPITMWGTYDKPKEPRMAMKKNSGIGGVILGVATAAMLLRRR